MDCLLHPMCKKLQIIIPAAGRGSRAALPYPKCLFPVRGVPIIQRLVETLTPFDPNPLIVTSPDGHDEIANALACTSATPMTTVQHMPKGMGDAILTALRSLEPHSASLNALVVWSDIPFLNAQTVRAMLQAHMDHQNALTFVTAVTDSAYTRVERDAAGAVVSVTETRESGEPVTRGERDIGLFVFQVEPMRRLLAEELQGKYGTGTGEHGFLYVIKHLVARGYRVEGLPIATPEELVSFNALSDIAAYLDT